MNEMNSKYNEAVNKKHKRSSKKKNSKNSKVLLSEQENEKTEEI